ncbi:MAG: hypothetical protein ACRDYD_06670 [Acidimicrobiales bacterium]
MRSISVPITVRLDEADHAALEKQADHIGVRPVTLARILVHAGLSGNAPVPDSKNGRAALERLVRRSQRQPPADAVALVAEARAALEPDR